MKTPSELSHEILMSFGFDNRRFGPSRTEENLSSRTRRPANMTVKRKRWMGDFDVSFEDAEPSPVGAPSTPPSPPAPPSTPMPASTLDELSRLLLDVSAKRRLLEAEPPASGEPASGEPASEEGEPTSPYTNEILLRSIESFQNEAGEHQDERAKSLVLRLSKTQNSAKLNAVKGAVEALSKFTEEEFNSLDTGDTRWGSLDNVLTGKSPNLKTLDNIVKSSNLLISTLQEQISG